MADYRKNFRTIVLLGSVSVVAACGNQPFDIDLRDLGNGFDTSSAAQNVTANRPAADSRGVISYPTYQVAIARQGDTVDSIAARIGANAGALATHNGLAPTTPLRVGEVLALPTRVAETAGGVTTTSLDGGTNDLAALAGSAIDRASPGERVGVSTPTPSGAEPIRHQVGRGETAFTIARLYNVPVRALADWNGLGADFAVREGQFLLIPVVIEQAAAPALSTPPSAVDPLPEETLEAPVMEVAPVAEDADPEPAPVVEPPVVTLETNTASGMVMPVNGSIIREYEKGKNDGIDISAPAGASVVAADSGTVAAITRDTDQVPIVVLRHADNVLTVYAGVEGLTVAKGDNVSKGQKIAVVRKATPSFLHFEVRRGLESADPMDFLN